MLRGKVSVAVLIMAGSVSSAAFGAVGDVYATRDDLVAKFDASLASGINSFPFTGWNYTDITLNQSSGKVYISSSVGGTSQLAMFDSTTLAHEDSSSAFIGWDFQALAVNESTGTLYAMATDNKIVAFDGTSLDDGIVSPELTGWGFTDMAINQTTGDIYVSAWDGTVGRLAKFDSDLNFLGSMVPHTGFDFTCIDINQSTGDVYIGDGPAEGYAQVVRVDGTTLAASDYTAAHVTWSFKGIAVNQTTGDVYAAGEDTGAGYSQVAWFDGTTLSANGPVSAAYIGWDFQGIDVDDTSGEVYASSTHGQLTRFSPTLGGLPNSYPYGSFTGDIVVQQAMIAVELDGDLNSDGFVGIEDLNIVLGNWNQNVTAGDPLQGDPTGDGFVGIEDLNQVLGNWNAGTPPTDHGVVPEPATVALLGIGMLAIARRR